MEVILSYNTNLIPDSITNPNVSVATAKDNTNPLSFLEFITITKIDYTPEEYNNFYLTYLKQWAHVKNSTEAIEKQNFVDLYVNFLKEIVIVYSTKQEQKFLSTIDYSNPSDLDITLPFFVNKIREIVIFYKQKRDQTKYVVDRNKIKGTAFSIERIIYEKIVEYIFSTQDTPTYLEIGTTLDQIKRTLDISIEEYVDVYGNYFDVPKFLSSAEGIKSIVDKPIIATEDISSSQLDELFNEYNVNDSTGKHVRGVRYTANDIYTVPRIDERLKVEDNTLLGINTISELVQDTQQDLRQELYTANFNDIDPKTFFDVVGIDDIFLSTAFLEELPLIANISFKADPVCDPSNPLDLFNNEFICKTGLTPQAVIDLRKQLIEKYAGVDFYYIDTTQVPTVSGILFKAQDPWDNIPNLQQVSTPTVPSGEDKAQIMLRNLGLFFKPDKIGLFQLDTKNYRYVIDDSVLVDQKVYVFPDPNVYGNVSANKQDTYPVLFIQDYTQEVSNTSRGIAQGDPIVSNKEQALTPYFSKSQSTEHVIPNEDTYNLNFTDLYNQGYITKLQYDIYGNEYALFKDDYGMTFKGISEKPDARIVSKLLNGHVFYDINEGYNFDYSVFSNEGTTLRSGISTLTVDDAANPLFPLSGYPLTLFFREFFPYQELFIPERNIIPEFKDGGGFTFLNDQPLPDPVSADTVQYPSPQTYYYSELTDGGVSSLEPLVRAILNTGDFTKDVKFQLSSFNVNDYDCGFFTDEIELQNDYNYDTRYTYLNFIDEKSETVFSTLTSNNTYITQRERGMLQGKLFVKNQAFSTSIPLSSAVASIFSKYSSVVKSDIYNNLIDYDVIYDTLVLETNNYLVIDKIEYDNGEYITPSTKNTVFSLVSSDPLTKVSNRFFNEKDKTITFCLITPEITDLKGNNKLTVPNIYQYNVATHRYKKIFPLNNTQMSSLSGIFSLTNTFRSDYNLNLVKIDKPQLTYNSLNDVYKLSYTGVDNNNLFHILNYTFFINTAGDVEISESQTYQHDKILRTTDFFSENTFALINTITNSPILIDGGKLTV